jgi:ABC-type multidrug transport system fused ATPase/permease subunit
LDESDSEAKGGLPLNFNSHIEICAVSYTFPGTQDEVLKDISVMIPRGASVGFIGGSGAGKSTLINIILGLLSPAHGNVKVDGQDIHSNLRGWKNLIGYVPQSIFLTDDTIRRNIAFGVPEEQINEDAIARVICAAQLKTFIGTLPEGVNTFVGERGTRLSGGQLQRIGIARALYHDPQVLILDEATSALDTMTETEVMGSIRALRGDKTILVVAHRLSTVVDCDWLYRLENGIVVQTEETKTVLNLPVN